VKRCHPSTARSEKMHHLPTCKTSDPKKTRRTTTVNTSLFSVVKKVTTLLEYQDVLPFQDALSFLKRVTYSVLHD
jgi:hypothetical protein